MNTIDESEDIFKHIGKSTEYCRRISPILQEIIDSDNVALMAVVLSSLTAGCAQGIKGGQDKREKFVNNTFKMANRFLELYEH